MSNRTDILIDENFDLLEDPATHDFVEGESTRQQQDLLIICDKGSFKENPESCVGAQQYLEGDNNNNDFMREVNKQYLADGMTNIKAFINAAGKIQINAVYK